jgi:CxxC-x17-CxxC domain-containing protein
LNQDPNRPMFDATCSGCGQQTQVPFQPSGDRPVFCNECFKKERANRPASAGRGNGPRMDRQMFDATCAACGQATQVPFRPTEGRPVYCLNCFKKDRA